MLTKATVVSVVPGYAIVETERRSACDGCHKAASGGCAMCALMGDSRRVSTRANDPIGVRPGDVVELETASSRVLIYAALVFLAPILLAAAGYLLGCALSFGDVGQAASAVIGFVFAFVFAGLYSRRIAAKRCDLTITRVLPSDSVPDHE